MFKRIVIVSMLVLGAFTILIQPVMAGEIYPEYFKMMKLVIGEKDAEVNFVPVKMDQPAYVKNGRTLVPFRFLGEALGAQISWDNASNQATLNLNGVEVKVTIGSKVAYVNGRIVALEVPAESKGGRTFIPLRFVSETMGAWVNYDDKTEAVRVRYVDKTTWKEYTQPLTEIKFKYPPDWRVEEEEDYIVNFTGPTESSVRIAYVQSKPGEVLDFIKKSNLEDSWDLDYEYFNDDKDPNKGGEISFSYYDQVIDDYIIYVVTVEPLAGNSGSYVYEQTFKDDNYEVDNTIMLDIANG